jgi:hypothetical protein
MQESELASVESELVVASEPPPPLRAVAIPDGTRYVRTTGAGSRSLYLDDHSAPWTEQYAQDDPVQTNYCGPVAGRNILYWYGMDASFTSLGSEMHTNTWQDDLSPLTCANACAAEPTCTLACSIVLDNFEFGTLPVYMEAALGKHTPSGFRMLASFEDANIDAILSQLYYGNPVVVLIKPLSSPFHWTVITGAYVSGDEIMLEFANNESRSLTAFLDDWSLENVGSSVVTKLLNGLGIRPYTMFSFERASGFGIWSKRSTASTTSGALEWTDGVQQSGDGAGIHNGTQLTGHFNDDGLTDIAFSYQSSSAGLTIRTKFSNGDGSFRSVTQALGDGGGVQKYRALVGDVDGDGRDDVIYVGQDWSGAGLNVRTKLSNGDGTWTEKSQVLGDPWYVHSTPTLIGDFNGDGCADLAFAHQKLEGWALNGGLVIRTKLSNCNGTWKSVEQYLGDGSGVHDYPTLVGDVNGDGRDDLIFVGQNWSGTGLNIRTKLATGTGTWTAKSQVLGDPSYVQLFPTHVGDFNNDGRADLAFAYQKPGAWGLPIGGLVIETKLSNGNGTWASAEQYLGDEPSAQIYPTVVGDFDGDHRTDLAFVMRDANSRGLTAHIKLAKGDSTWKSIESVFGDGERAHEFPTIVGDLDGNGRDDLAFLTRN